MSFYKSDADKQTGDGLSIQDWNDLSNAVAGQSSLHLALGHDLKVGIGTDNPQAALSISGDGKETNPDASMHITDDCILFGGNNAGKDTHSAQISAGKHEENSLNIVGMSSNTNYGTRKVTIWADAGLKVYGSITANSTITAAGDAQIDGTVTAGKFNGDGSGLTNLSVGLNGLNLATKSGSKVGIGTNNPSHILHVSENLNTGAVGLFETNRNNAFLRIQTSEGFNKRIELCNRPGGRAAIWINGSDRLSITQNGNVGIGTDSPKDDVKLHVKSDNFYTALLESKGSETCLLLQNNGGWDNRIELCNRPGKRAAIWVNGHDRFQVNHEGKVGIGLNIHNPKHTLTIGSHDGTHNRRVGFEVTQDEFKIHRIGNYQHQTKGWGDQREYISWNGDNNWDFLSDRKLKKDIENEVNILDRLTQFDVKSYRWKDNDDRKEKMIGFIAQDIQPHFPALVGSTTDEYTGETTLSLKYGGFGVLAVGAIKEMKQAYDAKISGLEQEITDLKNLIKRTIA
ncbi:MAG: tail fiber domain-containing protein [Oceanobacter sp.]